MEQEYICTKCKRKLTQYDFYPKHRRNPYELNSICKQCVSELAKKYYKKNKTKIKNLMHSTRQRRRSEGKCLCCENLRLPNSLSYCEYHYIESATQYALGKRNKKATKILLAKFQSNPYCPYTGDKLVLGINAQIDHIKPFSRFPEVRTDINNLEWVSRQANLCKSNLTKKEFIDFCRVVRSKFPGGKVQ